MGEVRCFRCPHCGAFWTEKDPGCPYRGATCPICRKGKIVSDGMIEN